MKTVLFTLGFVGSLNASAAAPFAEINGEYKIESCSSTWAHDGSSSTFCAVNKYVFIKSDEDVSVIYFCESDSLNMSCGHQYYDKIDASYKGDSKAGVYIQETQSDSEKKNLVTKWETKSGGIQFLESSISISGGNVSAYTNSLKLVKQ